MAIHIHPMNEMATHSLQTAHVESSPSAKYVVKPVSNFEALFSASARHPGVSVSSSATTSAGSSATSAPTASSPAQSTATPTSATSTSSVSSNSTSTTPVSAAAGDGPAGPLFGPNPWLTDPTGSGLGTATHYSPFYFATQQTAQTVANMVGGTVVAVNEMVNANSPLVQDQPNLMVQLPNGGMVNPGLIATFFTHNWPTSFINQQIANEVAGAAPASKST